MPEAIKLAFSIWQQNSLVHWCIACGVAGLTLILGVVVRRWVRRRYRVLAATEAIELMEVPLEIASETSLAFLAAAAVFVGFSTLSLPPTLRHGAARLFTLIAFWQVGKWASEAVFAWLLSRRRAASPSNPAPIGSLGIVAFVLRITVWAVVALLTLDNLGIDVTALVAGLGIGGIAIALAVQNVLGDLFASLSIALDRPFGIGDLIAVGDLKGRVEQIGVKSTRLRSVDGEQIILSNADLLRSRLLNFGRMTERRSVFTLGVTYETPHDKLQRIPELIQASIERTEGTRFDRCHFAKFGGFALEFETAYYVLSADYARFMALQQSIFFDIHAAFEREQIEFAYPTRKVWVSSQDKAPSARRLSSMVQSTDAVSAQTDSL